MKNRIYSGPAVKVELCFNPYVANHDYNRFLFVLLADQITVIRVIKWVFKHQHLQN